MSRAARLRKGGGLVGGIVRAGPGAAALYGVAVNGVPWHVLQKHRADVAAAVRNPVAQRSTT
eukprot:3796202-Alexandrium_andersonii.AAC.1